MAETLLSPSNILLYGRVLEDLKFSFVDPSTKGPEQESKPPPRLGANNSLLEQLRAGDDSKKKGDAPVIARIYGFSFEGHYFDLARPALFVVHGPGVNADDVKPPNRVSRAPSDADRTGVAAQGYTFSDDIKVWSYDKADLSIRFDVETGPFEQILLEAEVMVDGGSMSYSGANVRGANVRGANVRGANVRGANVRGANVRGAGNLGD